MKLHLGCGAKHFVDFVNIDIKKVSGADRIANAKKLDYPPNSIERIETYHMIEHVRKPDVRLMLKHWHSLLIPNGILVIECPDFDEAVKQYLAGNQMRIQNIFGLQRWIGDEHYWGYNFKRLFAELAYSGFRNIIQAEPQDAHKKIEPCLRVECVKGSQ